jgi:hypothetical protein
MPIADTQMSRISFADFLLESGEGDVFYARELANDGRDLAPYFIAQSINRASSNSSMTWPIAKWPEVVMKKMDEVAVDHGWTTEFADNPAIGPSGFNWYAFAGTYRIPIIPNSGQPYTLGGYNCNNINFWKQLNDNLNFFNDNTKIENDGSFAAVIVPVSDVVENYDEVSGYISRWGNVFGSIGQLTSSELNILFDPYASGYSLFQEYPPSDDWTHPAGVSSRFPNYFYQIPYSGLASQPRLTKQQGFSKIFDVYIQYVNQDTYHNLTLFNSFYTMSKLANKSLGNHVNYSTPLIEPDYASGISALQNDFSQQEWCGSIFHPSISTSAIGNYQRLEYNVLYHPQQFDTGIREGVYNEVNQSIRPFGNTLHINVPSGVSLVQWIAQVSSHFSYGLIPVSSRAFGRITTGESGITHKLNERWLSSPSTSIRARYGLSSGNFNKLFFPIQTDQYVAYDDGIGSNHFEVEIPNTMTVRNNQRTDPSTWNSFVMGLGCDNGQYDALHELNNLLEVGQGFEVVYGHIDVISEIHEPNVELLRGYNFDAINYSNTLYETQMEPRLLPSSGYKSGTSLTHLLGASGVFISDVIVEKINNNQYTVLYDRSFPSVETDGSGVLLEKSDFSNSASFPDNLLQEVPPPSSTHVWVAIKAKEFEKNFVLENPPLIPIENPFAYRLIVSGLYINFGAFRYMTDYPDTLLTKIPLPLDLNVSNYVAHYVDRYTSLLNSNSGPAIDGLILTTHSGVTTTDFNKQLFAMKNIDNDINESLIPFYTNSLYATSRLGTYYNSGVPAVELSDGSISGNLAAFISIDYPPRKGYPISV